LTCGRIGHAAAQADGQGPAGYFGHNGGSAALVPNSAGNGLKIGAQGEGVKSDHRILLFWG
jgi:hypothetical protein